MRPPPPERSTTAVVRTFLAVALQMGRAFPHLVDLAAAIFDGRRSDMRLASVAIATAVLKGARDRGGGNHVRTVIDIQRRSASLTRLRKSRKGRGPQAVAARKRRER